MKQLDQLPPFDAEAEQGALACILTANGTGPELFAQLSLDHFYEERHRATYRALCEIKSPDEVSLLQWARDHNQTEALGGIEYLGSLADKTPSSANFEFYLETLQDRATRRAWLRDSAEGDRLARDLTIPASTIADASRRMIEAHAKSNAGADFTIRTPNELLAMKFDDSDCVLGDRLLARGQSLVVTGAGGTGKSRMMLQIAAACIIGRDFVGIETHAADLRWLFLQVENNCRRLSADLSALRKWCGSDWPAVNERMRVHTTEGDADLFVKLDNEANCRRISRAIADHDPDVVVWDSLYNFAIGDLNADEGMAATLGEISRLTRHGKPDRSPVVIHHALTGRHGAAKATGFDRSSFARNSKVLLAWTRAQINVAPGSAENNDSLVIACGKNSNGKEFSKFAVRLSPETMIYEPDPGFDFSDWESQLGGRDGQKPLMNPERVRELCRSFTSKADLAKAIMEDCGCYRGSAYRYIARSVNRTIRFNKTSETYSPK